jgi:hypothetical protein
VPKEKKVLNSKGGRERPPSADVPSPKLGIELLVHIGERRSHEYIDTPKQVVLRDTVIEPKLIEQPRLIAPLSTHHGRLRPHRVGKAESLFAANLKPFFDSIDPSAT